MTSLCKKHFQASILSMMRKELRNVYRGPDKAYASMDFTGVGHITEGDFTSSLTIKNLELSEEEMRDFLFLSNM